MVFLRYYKRLKIVYFGTAVTELVRAEPFVFSWHPHMYMYFTVLTVIISVVSPLCDQVSFLVLKL